MKILIISSAENEENMATNDRFVQKLNDKLGSQFSVEWQNYSNIGLALEKGKISAFIVSTKIEIKDFDLVYFKSVFRHAEQAASIVEYLTFYKVNFVGKELKKYVASYKLTQMARLAKGNLPIPKTLYLSNDLYLLKFNEIQKSLGDKFIFKAIEGSTGDDNYLVENKPQLSDILNNNPELHYIAQQFIPNKSDLRILIVGDKPSLVIERSRTDHSTHLNNTSQGAKAKLISLSEFPDELINLALSAHKVMDREVSGVDIMLEADSKNPYILEVNASPQIASGAFEEEKLDIYVQYFKSFDKAKA